MVQVMRMVILNRVKPESDAVALDESALLDEALPLDAAERRDWLDKLSPEYREFAQYLEG